LLSFFSSNTSCQKKKTKKWQNFQKCFLKNCEQGNFQNKQKITTKKYTELFEKNGTEDVRTVLERNT